jgi:hypothetical protein
VSGEHVPLEIGWDVDHEGIFSRVHRGNDVAHGNGLRRFEQRWLEGVRDAPGEVGMVLVGNGDRGIMELLRIALRRGDHGVGERIHDKPDQHIVTHEAPQLLGSEPVDVGDAAHRK